MLHTVKRYSLLLAGVVLVAIGLIFVIIPGPSLIFIVLGLTCLSLFSPKCRSLLKYAQTLSKKSAVWIDRQLLLRRLSK
ncbi:PGPGW domain-containing protein [Flocculibacter collagenilyticus]|uniref:PGPGW domain-containing protein n=1 Tax=Flocculibacter collagenilyticus TaxID=2744479 RepID=UPI0018F2A6B6|nr:PGPGW domain-containing protein [Flocculibacter collagenilyticus]